MQIRKPGDLTRDGCREMPAASLARTQNGRGAGLGGYTCAAVPWYGAAAGERRYRRQVGGAEVAGGVSPASSLAPVRLPACSVVG